MRKALFRLVVFLFGSLICIFAQAPSSLDSLYVYKGEEPGTGPGISVLKLALGESVILTVKGVDKDGKEVCIAPTWKADKEISLIPVEGKGKSIKLQLREAPSVAAFFSVVVIREDGKKISTDVAVELKK